MFRPSASWLACAVLVVGPQHLSVGVRHVATGESQHCVSDASANRERSLLNKSLPFTGG